MKKLFTLFALPMLLAAVCFTSCEPGNNPSKPATSDKVETLAASEITASQATLSGKVNVDIADYKDISFGVLLSTDKDEINQHKGTKYTAKVLEGKDFEVTVQNLSAATEYFYCAWVFLNGIQYEYGAVKSFKTEKSQGSSGGDSGDAHAGVQMVDLGLSVKWANMNVGATCGTTAESWYGSYFAWGETQPKDTYNWSTYKWCNGSYDSQTKYCIDSEYGEVDYKTTLEAVDDATAANWCGSWRMPTKAEQDELREKCTWTWITSYQGISGLNGYVVSATNGNSIFLPADGYRSGSSLYDAGSYGYYWSSSLSSDYSNNAYFLYFGSSLVDWGDGYRCLGQSVRPVCP